MLLLLFTPVRRPVPLFLRTKLEPEMEDDEATALSKYLEQHSLSNNSQDLSGHHDALQVMLMSLCLDVHQLPDTSWGLFTAVCTCVRHDCIASLDVCFALEQRLKRKHEG